MKNTFTTLFALLAFCAIGQKVQPIQIQTIDTTTYVVEYIPIATAQKNVDAQLVQVDKQLATVEKQMADLLKKRDELMKQKAALEFMDKQLAQAADAPPPAAPQKASEPPKEEKPKKQKAKTKSKN